MTRTSREIENVGRERCAEKKQRPSIVGAGHRAAHGKEQTNACTELTYQIERPETGARLSSKRQEHHELENDDRNGDVDQMAIHHELLHVYDEGANPRRWATSLKKIRMCAAGLARTSSLFI